MARGGVPTTPTRKVTVLPASVKTFVGCMVITGPDRTSRMKDSLSTSPQSLKANTVYSPEFSAVRLAILNVAFVAVRFSEGSISTPFKRH